MPGSAAALTGGAAAEGAATAVTSGDPKAAGVYGREAPGLTDAQREALYTNNRIDFQHKLDAWYANLDIHALNLHDLDRAGTLATFQAADATSLRAAVANAHTVIEGTVTDIRAVGAKPGKLPESFVTIHVDSTLKGASGASIVVHQLGGLVPSLDWKTVQIQDADPTPLLLPGDRALLLLMPDSANPSSYMLQNYTGEYSIAANGRISSVPGNPFAGDVEGTSIESLRSAVTAAVLAP